MRTPALLLASLALLSLLPGAEAQQQGSLVITLNAPEEPVRAGEMVSFVGTVVLTVDYTAALSLTGIPVSYTAQGPEWASVVISPANDVFPPPYAAVPGGLSYTTVRTISITVSASNAPAQDVIEALMISATTYPGPFATSITGQGAVQIAFDAVDEECDEAHAAELVALAREAAETYSKQGASQDVTSEAPTTSGDEGELIVQNTGSAPLSLPWIAVAGFALVGAGVGLVMRRRFK